jgi:hypothetical protein
MVQEKLGLLDNCKSYGCSKLILIYHICRKYRCQVFSRELLLITPNLKELHEFYSELNFFFVRQYYLTVMCHHLFLCIHYSKENLILNRFHGTFFKFGVIIKNCRAETSQE